MRFSNHAARIELYHSERSTCHVYIFPLGAHTDVRLMSSHIMQTWRERRK